jgi:hypothetical protein
MELSLELTAPMMRDFAPPGAMPFHVETQFVWQHEPESANREPKFSGQRKSVCGNDLATTVLIE